MAVLNAFSCGWQLSDATITMITTRRIAAKVIGEDRKLGLPFTLFVVGVAVFTIMGVAVGAAAVFVSTTGLSKRHRMLRFQIAGPVG